jgi:hypothetical protein
MKKIRWKNKKQKENECIDKIVQKYKNEGDLR